jgi:hypothetical protein
MDLLAPGDIRPSCSLTKTQLIAFCSDRNKNESGQLIPGAPAMSHQQLDVCAA